jgi:hypothetical protein
MHDEMEWLKTKKGVLKIDKIERELNLAQGTLAKYVKGERGLSKATEKKLIKWVNDFQLKKKKK